MSEENKCLALMFAKNGVVATEALRYPDITNQSILCITKDDLLSRVGEWYDAIQLINNQKPVN